jgi:putative oxidoreductase
MPALASLQSYARSLLRVVAAFAFSSHGLQKLFGFFGGMGGKGITAAFPSLPWFAGGLEVVGGLLLLLGLVTRPVAFLLSGEMAVGYFLMHYPRGFFPITNGGELAAVYSFLFLYLSLAGPGPISLDALVRKKG